MMKHAKELSGVAAGLTLLAGAAIAQGAGGAAAGPRPTQVTITAKDSAGRTLIFRGNSPVIDSLIRRLDNLPVGSVEFFATDSAIQAAMRAMPRPTQPGGISEFHIEISAPRAAVRVSPMDVVPQGTLGFTAAAVNRVWYTPVGQYLQYFEYPTVVAIEANSPASRAGVRSGDSLLAYNGLDLKGQAINLTQLLTPGRDVSVRVRRDGEAREVVVEVQKAPDRLMTERRAEAASFMAMMPATAPTPAFENSRRQYEERMAVTAAARAQGATMPQGGGAVAVAKAPVAARTVTGSPYMGSPMGMLGAAMSEVDAGLAASIVGMTGKRGVLVTMVPEGSFASRIGLRSGDVILKAEDAEVATVAQLRVRLYLADQTAEKVKLTVLRAGKSSEITYTPR